jgi:1-acyl-sn-glycerol-3-phosphate acyltransferase
MQTLGVKPRPPEAIHAATSLLQRGARVLLKSFGWQVVLVPLPAPKGIIIVYPHTSNWDFFIGVLYKAATGLPVRWIGKHTLFRWPVRSFLVHIGGIPIRRDQGSGLVDALLAEFARNEWLWLALTPEGTRSRTDYWKSGFYRLALEGHLPVGLGYIDYATRRIGIDTYLSLSGNVHEDLDRIRAFYADKRGRRPEDAGEIRLRE